MPSFRHCKATRQFQCSFESSSSPESLAGEKRLGSGSASTDDAANFLAPPEVLRFLTGWVITVSGGSNPNSTDMVSALGIESQVRPLGAIHFRRLRFYQGRVRNVHLEK